MIIFAETYFKTIGGCMETYRINLTEDEREQLHRLTKKGKTTVKRVRNALILLNCDESSPHKRLSNEVLAQALNIGTRTIDRVKKTFVEEGMEIVLNGRPRQRKYDKKIDGEAEAYLIALCCSEAPKGYGKWSLRLLADKMVELNYVESISHETVRRVLKKRVKALEKYRMGNTTGTKQRFCSSNGKGT